MEKAKKLKQTNRAIIKVCQYCGKKFIDYENRRDRIRKYCSRECSIKARPAKKKKQICPNCNKEFYREPSKKIKFCSIKCAHEYKKIIRYTICHYCKEAFFIPDFAPATMKTKRHLYCSRRCYEKDEHRLALVEVKCEYCNKKFKRIKANLRKSKKYFCNRDCQLKYQKARIPVREQKVEVICPMCGEKRNILRIVAARTKTGLCQKCAYKMSREKRIRNLRKARKVKRHKIKCDNCGKTLNLTQKEIANYEKHFCDRKCRNEYEHKKIPTAKCDYCGKEIKRSQCTLAKVKNHFCSQKCHYQYMREQAKKEFICEGCGKKFFMTPSQEKQKREKGSKKFYCSQECFLNSVKANALPKEMARAIHCLKLTKSLVEKYNLWPILELKYLQLKLKKEIKNAN